jgi:hypothetical protein
MSGTHLGHQATQVGIPFQLPEQGAWWAAVLIDIFFERLREEVHGFLKLSDLL